MKTQHISIFFIKLTHTKQKKIQIIIDFNFFELVLRNSKVYYQKGDREREIDR